MTELEMLDACLEQCERLGSVTEETFSLWANKLEDGHWKQLSPKQRQWLDDKCRDLGIETGAANLVSSGHVQPTAGERESLKLFHEELGPKPLKPPGRRK